MIDKDHRFQGHNSLRFVYQKGAVVRGSFGVVKYCLNRRRDTWRAAVVVSRKVSKSAVVRNRIRRRVFESLRAYGREITAPYDIVIIIYSDQVAVMPAAQLRAGVRERLTQAGILPSSSVAPAASRAIVEPKES